jgi:hypothetical protein
MLPVGDRPQRHFRPADLVAISGTFDQSESSFQIAFGLQFKMAEQDGGFYYSKKWADFEAFLDVSAKYECCQGLFYISAD